MGKKKTIENCVGTVTVSTRIQNGAVTTTYQFKAGLPLMAGLIKELRTLSGK